MVPAYKSVKVDQGPFRGANAAPVVRIATYSGLISGWKRAAAGASSTLSGGAAPSISSATRTHRTVGRPRDLHVRDDGCRHLRMVAFPRCLSLRRSSGRESSRFV